MKLIRYLRASAIVAGVLAILTLGGASAPAMLPEQNHVPANALLAIGIADTADFWNKAGALAFTQAITQYLDSPQMNANLGFQQFMLDRRKLEQTLDYPATPEEFFKNVFHSALICGLPAGAQGKPVISLILGVRDPAKAARLVQALDKRNQELAANPPTPPVADPGGMAAPAGGSAATVSFNTLQVGKVKVSHVCGKSADGTVQDGYYALAGDHFYFTNNPATIEQWPQSPPQSIEQNPEFSQRVKALPWKAADVTGWMDSAALMVVNKNPMLGMVSKLGQSEKIAFTLQVQAGGIVGQVASTPEATPLKPRRLAGIGFLPPAPLTAMVYGQLDPAKSVQELQGLLGLMAMSQQMSGSQGTGQIQNPLTELEQMTGISVDNELVPALGHEMMISINDLRLGLMGGQGTEVNLLLGVEVRDAAKMKVVLDKLERAMESKMGGTPAAGSGPNDGAPRFQTLAGGPAPIRTLNTGNPILNPSYAMLNHYLVFGLNPRHVQAALSRGMGQAASARASAAFGEMRALAGSDQILSYSVVDVTQVSQTVLMPFLSLALLSGNSKMSSEQQQQVIMLVTQVLPKIGTGAAVETMRDGLALGYFKVKM